MILKQRANELLIKLLGLRVIREEMFQKLNQQLNEGQPNYRAFSVVKSIFTELGARPHILPYMDKSTSQLKQDLFVLCVLDMKREGFFVEFGATNGISLSNTYLLEKEFGWDGILSEPARCWHDELKGNRRVAIDFDCVWSESGKLLMFNETNTPELSTVGEFSDSDCHKEARQKGRTYEVSTISLNDLLVKHNAPSTIDYLSLDTEGSELKILNAFDFSKWEVGIITCEHNYTPNRKAIFDLLAKKEFVRVCEEVSEFDDWYINKKLLNENQ